MQNLTSISQSSSGNLTIAPGKTLKLSGTLSPSTSDGAALGSTSLMWSDLFLASGGVINFNAGDVTLTHSENTLTVAGGDLVLPTITIGTGIVPDANDGAYLGQAGTAFSDLFLAEGGVINWDSGDATLTQASDVVTLAGASLTLAAGGTVNDDMVFTLGTTTATAETKITLEFDETTTGIGQFIMGSTSVPMVLNTNPGATVVGSSVNIAHSAGAGDNENLIASYEKVAMSGDGDSGVTLVGTASRAYIGTEAGSTTVAAECYGAQPWCSHFGTGAVTAMSALSAKCDVNTGNFTATTVNAGHFHVEGASTVTSSMFDGVMIEVHPDVTCLDAGLRIVTDTGAVMTDGINISGAMTNGINIGGTATTGLTISGPTTAASLTGVSSGVGITVSTLNKTSGRALKIDGSVAAVAHEDGYGIEEINANFSGTFGGPYACASSTWINVAAAAVPGGIVTVRNDGIYVPTGITSTAAKMIIGARMHYVADDGADPGSLFLWSTNIYANKLTALLDINSIEDLNNTTAKSSGGIAIPFAVSHGSAPGTVYYLNLYTS